ncbi:hypothetical protein GCM10029964_126500 [Kibdelosporangium lantanae]
MHEGVQGGALLIRGGDVVSEVKTPNTRLAALMRQANATNKGLARRVRALSETDGQGEPVRADHVAVKRWLDGTRPHPVRAG